MIDTQRVIVPIDFAKEETRLEHPTKVVVDQADFKISQDPQITLCTAPLGACLGIAVYDTQVKVAGLLTCMLPSSSLDARRAAERPGMFIDTGWAALMTRAQQLKVTKENLRVFVAGAAEIMDDTSLFNIGRLNQDFLREFLRQMGFSVNAENLGGRTNCSMELAVATGEVRLRFSGQIVSSFLCKP